MIRISSDVSDYFRFQNLSLQKGITHFVSTNIRKQNEKIVHDFDLSFSTGLSKETVMKNREILAVETGFPLTNFVMQEQVHSDRVEVIGNEHKGMGVFNKEDALPVSDAMITNHQQIGLFLFAADCVPVLFYDPRNSVIGAAHSGWKGTVGKIAQKTVLAMKNSYGTNPEDVLVGVLAYDLLHRFKPLRPAEIGHLIRWNACKVRQRKFSGLPERDSRTMVDNPEFIHIPVVSKRAWKGIRGG